MLRITLGMYFKPSQEEDFVGFTEFELQKALLLAFPIQM